MRDLIRLVEGASGVADAETYLAAMVAKDQGARHAFSSLLSQVGDWTKARDQWLQQHKTKPDDIFGERDRLADFRGRAASFPFDQFSKEAWHNFWLLAQHCDFDRKFQTWCLSLISHFVGVDSDEFRYLSDRISCGLHGTQKFNTQDGCSCDDQA